MALENVTRPARGPPPIELVQQKRPENPNWLREWRSRRRRSADSCEVIMNLDVARGAGPGFELGWEAGIRTPIPWSRGEPRNVGDFGSCRFCSKTRADRWAVYG